MVSLQVFGLLYVSSQATKVPRAAGILALAPLVSSGLDTAQRTFRLTSKQQVRKRPSSPTSVDTSPLSGGASTRYNLADALNMQALLYLQRIILIEAQTTRVPCCCRPFSFCSSAAYR